MRSDSPQKIFIDLKTHRLCVHEWKGEGPTLLFLHATGFHGRVWDQIIRQFPERHVLSVDMRSHGYSGSAPYPEFWRDLAEDVYQLVEQLNLTQVYGIGHSCGGHLALLAAARYPELFRHILALDPVVFDRALLPMFERLAQADHPVAKRRNQWSSREELYERFRTRTPYSNWSPDVLQDYCQHALRAKKNGEDFELACAPDEEAEVYRRCFGEDIYKALPQIQVPVTVVRARDRTSSDPLFDFSPSPTWRQLASHLPNATDIQFPEYSHFFPMEHPEVIPELIRQMEQSEDGKPIQNNSHSAGNGLSRGE